MHVNILAWDPLPLRPVEIPKKPDDEFHYRPRKRMFISKDHGDIISSPPKVETKFAFRVFPDARKTTNIVAYDALNETPVEEYRKQSRKANIESTPHLLHWDDTQQREIIPNNPKFSKRNQPSTNIINWDRDETKISHQAPPIILKEISSLNNESPKKIEFTEKTAEEELRNEQFQQREKDRKYIEARRAHQLYRDKLVMFDREIEEEHETHKQTIFSAKKNEASLHTCRTTGVRSAYQSKLEAEEQKMRAHIAIRTALLKSKQHSPQSPFIH